MYSISIFLFYIILIWGGVRTQRTPLPTGLYLTGYRHRGELGSLVLNTCIAVGVHTEVHCELQFSSLCCNTTFTMRSHCSTQTP